MFTQHKSRMVTNRSKQENIQNSHNNPNSEDEDNSEDEWIDKTDMPPQAAIPQTDVDLTGIDVGNILPDGQKRSRKQTTHLLHQMLKKFPPYTADADMNDYFKDINSDDDICSDISIKDDTDETDDELESHET